MTGLGCGDVFDLRDEPDPAQAAMPAKSDRELERKWAVEEARRLAAEQRRREIAEAKANRIEDDVAELKKRIFR